MDFGIAAREFHNRIWGTLRPTDHSDTRSQGWDQRMVASERVSALRPHAPAAHQVMAIAPLTPPSDNDTVPSPRTSPSQVPQQRYDNAAFIKMEPQRTSPTREASPQSQENSFTNIEHQITRPNTEDVDEFNKRLQHHHPEENNNSMDASSPKEYLKNLENMMVPTSSPDDSCSGSDNGKTPLSSKRKTYKCKPCELTFDSQVEKYRHSKIHLRPDKILICKICEFCTEFKHHFEYHMRNHEGTKPFKCDQCPYSCVNRSMLTSHQKSHSSVYQYRCNNCAYSAKYLHALKQHCKKNGHQPGLVLNSDGTPNPYPIIDVYGSRRGPRKTPKSSPSMKPLELPPVEGAPMLPQNAFLLAQLHLQFLMQQQAHLHNASNAFQNDTARAISPENSVDTPHPAEALETTPHPQEAVDNTLHSQEAVDNTPQRPKGPQALDLSIKQEEMDDDMTDEEEMDPSMCVEVNYESSSPPRNVTEQIGMCKHCNIQFGNMIMHQIHMGYHSHGNPLLCNKCGVSFEDSIQFFSHIGMSCKPSQS